MIGSGSPPYGYKYNTDRSNYEVDEETMPVVRRMFEMVAAGSTLHSVKATFESEGIATPGGGQRWYTVSMRRMVLNDVYKGTWWYGVNRVKLTPMGDKRRTWERNPESEHVAVPVPDAGIPHEVIVAARSRIRNGYSPRQDAKHYYELRGLLYCIECGAKMTGYSTGDGSRYYTCQKRRKWGKSACDGANRTARTPTKRRRSVGIENEVMDYVQDIISDPAKLTAQLDAAIAQEARKNPAQDVATWLNMIEDCDRKRATYQDQQAAWLMTLEELGDKLQHLSGTKEAAEQHVAQARGGERRVEELRATKRAMPEAYEQGIYYDGIGAFSPEMRREIYEALRLKVTVGHDLLKFEADVDADVIRLTREVEAYAEEVEQYRGKLKVTSLRGTDKVMAEVAG